MRGADLNYCLKSTLTRARASSRVGRRNITFVSTFLTNSRRAGAWPPERIAAIASEASPATRRRGCAGRGRRRASRLRGGDGGSHPRRSPGVDAAAAEELAEVGGRRETLARHVRQHARIPSCARRKPKAAPAVSGARARARILIRSFVRSSARATGATPSLQRRSTSPASSVRRAGRAGRTRPKKAASCSANAGVSRYSASYRPWLVGDRWSAAPTCAAAADAFSVASAASGASPRRRAAGASAATGASAPRRSAGAASAAVGVRTAMKKPPVSCWCGSTRMQRSRWRAAASAAGGGTSSARSCLRVGVRRQLVVRCDEAGRQPSSPAPPSWRTFQLDTPAVRARPGRSSPAEGRGGRRARRRRWCTSRLWRRRGGRGRRPPRPRSG